MFTCRICGSLTQGALTEDAVTQYTCGTCLNRINKEVAYQSENEHWHEATVICPHCDYGYESYDSYTDFEPGDDLEKVICPECGKTFELEVEEIRYFSTKKHVCEMPKEESEAT